MKNKVTITPRNLAFPIASYLKSGDQSVYEEACKQFNSDRARKTLNIGLKGSNLFKVILLNQIGINTATAQDLDRIAEENPAFLKGHYEDIASVVLRGKSDSYNSDNSYLANSLAKLVRKRKFNNPIVINGLELEEDINSAYGLSFKEGKNFEFFEAPELSQGNNHKKFNISDERGIPIFDSNGNRTLYTRSGGLSRLGVDYDLDLGSDWGILADSYSVGRVVKIDAGGVANSAVEKYISEVNKETDQKIARIKSIRDEAVKDIKQNK